MTSEAKLHPDNATLERYSLGHLTGCELERVEEHLFVCDFCQDELTQVDMLVRDLKVALTNTKQLPEREPLNLLRYLFSFPRPVLAGAFAALALVAVLPLATQQSGVPLTPEVVQMRTFRGQSFGSGTGSAHRPLHLAFAISKGNAFSVEIVNQKGSILWKGAASRRDVSVTADTPAFAPGDYWVRLFSDGHLTRESRLELR